MPRRRGRRKAPQHSQEDMDAGSEGSQGSEVSSQDVMEDYIDCLYEKRPTTRLAALGRLTELLCSAVCQEDFSARQETLTRMFMQSVMRGKGNERIVGARALGLLVLSLGLEDGSTRIWNETKDKLLLVADGRDPAVAAAAVETFAIACFVGEEDMIVVLDCMSKLTGLWTKENPQLRAKAISSWTFLLSLLVESFPFDPVMECLAALRSFLDDNNLNVRKAAGEGIALLNSISGMHEDVDMAEEYSDTMSIASSSTCLSRYSAMDEVVDKMKDLSRCQDGGGKKKSKKERHEQRSAFREFCGIMEDGVLQETRIKLRYGDSLVIDDLSSIIRLNFIKSILAEGFQAHIQNNELLHQMFDYEPRLTPMDKLTRQEKRMYRSPSSHASKSRSSNRQEARRQKDWLLSGDGMI